VLVRTGRPADAPLSAPRTLPGLHPDTAAWFHARGVALVGGDGATDVEPPIVEGVAMPMHALLLVAMGVPLIDNATLEALAAACAQERRWSFAFALTVPDFAGATGFPANPIAIL